MGNLLSQEDALKRIYDVNPTITILSEFKGWRKPIKRECNVCGDIRIVNAKSLVEKTKNGQVRKCPVCAARERALLKRKTNKQFISELYDINPNIEPLEEYTTNDVYIRCRCKIDGHIWSAKPHSLLQSHGCPECNRSLGELEVKRVLDKHNISYDTEFTFPDCKNKILLRFDFYLKDINTCVEYQGRQHYEPVSFGSTASEQEIIHRFNVQCKNDEIKKQYCQDNNIKLITIPYTDFDNIEQILNKYIS